MKLTYVRLYCSTLSDIGGGDGVYLAWTPEQPKPLCCCKSCHVKHLIHYCLTARLANNRNVFYENDASNAGTSKLSLCWMLLGWLVYQLQERMLLRLTFRFRTSSLTTPQMAAILVFGSGSLLWHSSLRLENARLPNRSVDSYSRDSVVQGNLIANNNWVGIAIDHGQNNTISGNVIINNGYQNAASGYPPPWQPHGILVEFYKHIDATRLNWHIDTQTR